MKRRQKSPAVIGLVKRQVPLEHVQPVVDGVDQADLAGQGMDGTDAAVRDAAAAVGKFIMDVACGEHRLAASAELRLVQSSLDAALAVAQLPAYRSVHSKSLLSSEYKKAQHLLRLGKHRRISSFSVDTPADERRVRLVRG